MPVLYSSAVRRTEIELETLAVIRCPSVAALFRILRLLLATSTCAAHMTWRIPIRGPGMTGIARRHAPLSISSVAQVAPAQVRSTVALLACTMRRTALVRTVHPYPKLKVGANTSVY